MKRIGLMCGREYSFPPAFIEKVNELKSLRGEQSVETTADQTQYEPMPASLNELFSKSSAEFDSILAKASPVLAPVPTGSTTLARKETPPRATQSGESEKTTKSSKTQLLFGSAFFIILAIVVSYFLTTMNQAEENLPQKTTQAQNTNLVQRTDTETSIQPQAVAAKAALSNPVSVTASNTQTATQQAADSLHPSTRGNE